MSEQEVEVVARLLVQRVREINRVVASGMHEGPALTEAARSILSALSSLRGGDLEGNSSSSADGAACGLTASTDPVGGTSLDWVLVPREPTEAMLRAGYVATHSPTATPAGGFTRWATWEEACEMDGWREEKAAVYRAMISAALSPLPSPIDPKSGDGVEGEAYWFLENPHGEWLVRYTDGKGLPIVSRDHTQAWRFSSRLAADECRMRVLGYEWKDEFGPTEHADFAPSDTSDRQDRTRDGPPSPLESGSLPTNSARRTKRFEAPPTDPPA